MTDKNLLREFEELKKENEQLRQKLSKLKIGDTQGASIATPVPAPKGEAEAPDEWLESDIRLLDSDLYNEIFFDPEYGVLVVSMVGHTLVLREQRVGGAEYIFKKLGSKKHIRYESMVKVFEYNRKFFDKGTFAILDTQFCKKFGVKNAALPLGTMKRLIEGQIPADEAVVLFSGMPEHQQKETARAMISNLMKNQNFYKASFLARLEVEFDLRLAERAKDSVALKKIYAEEGAKRG